MTKSDERLTRAESDIHYVSQSMSELKESFKSMEALVLAEIKEMRKDLEDKYVKKDEIASYKTFVNIVGIFLFISLLITFISKVFPGFIFWK